MRWCPGSFLHLLRCVLPRCCSRRGRSRLPLCLRELKSYTQVLAQSLFFNSLTDSDVVFDSVFEPVLWTVDYVTRWFGTVFVYLVVVLTSSIVLIAYVVLLPLILNTYSPMWIAWHVCYGHWNLVMIAFHYYKAAKTSPGYPPTEKNDIPFVSVCKKCILPKPARTHHCGICNRCILKMDHHCPWLNNCVGHFNHRYFFSFCLFMTLGCVYCSISGRNLFLEAYNALERFKHMDMEKPGVPVTGMGVLIGLLPSGQVLSFQYTHISALLSALLLLLLPLMLFSVQTNYQTPAPPYTYKDRMIHKSIIYMWVLTSTVGVALGALTAWHAILISRGETSIERHINAKETKRLATWGRVYKNPFYYGKLNNWRIFLGVEKQSHWVTRVLLPSGHSPRGDGMTWDIFPLKKDLIPV
ncbi:palmitoyltransferase ZDHHC16A isoform X1 [Synchiropus splendidus]|uniref:palmitoyltransferase ZDHHC16A isoform X1 n=1 Tax=Synchiropus splendidus TaxID=270530 RepID=UPI00237D9C01|nr:palmitoyltransferase ZDHHC16A isoform X1 [Synchiropus splendidus]